MTRPVFRFAPSPNGRLHLGHAASALLNADLARRMTGRLLLRMEDIDPERSRPDLAKAIREDLAWLGLRFEEPVRHQSQHLETYRAQVDILAAAGLAYPCFCSRRDIAAKAADQSALTGLPVRRDPDGAPLYPGTCRHLPPPDIAARRAAGAPHTWRLAMDRALAVTPGPFRIRVFDPDRPAGNERETHDPRAAPPSPGAPPAPPLPSGQGVPAIESAIPDRQARGGGIADPARWGDAVIARRDVPTSYHLAVVMDDAAQGVTHVVRGADLLAATDLHLLLQALIGVPSPAYLHHPLIRDPSGEKLAKSRGSRSLADLRTAGITPEAIRRRLGFPA